MTKKFMLMMRFPSMRVFLLTERNTERIAEHITERITEHLQPLSPCAPRPPNRLRIR